MDYLLHNISTNLKRIRKSKSMSLDILAEQTGVSKSMLAQIERGMANPSIGILGKIVSGLRVEFNDLLSTPHCDFHLVSVKDMVPTREMEGQYKVWTCFPYGDNKTAEICRIDLEPQGVYSSKGHGEKAKEYIAVITGEVSVELKDGKQLVTSEDVFRFGADQPHKYVNPLDTKTSFMVFCVTE